MSKTKGKSKKAKVMKSFLYLYLSVFICGQISSVLAQSDASQQNKTGKPGTFAITNARIVTVSGATIERGTLVIKDGKIESLGANVTVPSGAEKIDGTGLSVYPGMIDAGTNLGLAEIGGGAPATIDVSETGDMNSNAKAILGINPHSSHVNVTRINGITTVLSMPLMRVTLTCDECGLMPKIAFAFEFISPVSATSIVAGAPPPISAKPRFVPASIIPG